MIILGIETSCDETAAAVVADGQKILSTNVASSLKLHQETGGIIPETAAREQVKAIIPVLQKTLKEAFGKTKIPEKKLDALAVTVGPGLIGSLLVGVETAKTLALVWQKPLVPVNHLLAHLYAGWLEKEKDEQPQFPLLGLIVSGGHTSLVLMKDHRTVRPIGQTRDDAAGECFDKTGRLLDLGYPAGPKIEKLAQAGNAKHYPLPRPMLNQNNFDFSFSGLKTAVYQTIQKEKNFNQADLAAAIQTAVTEVLVKKTLAAAQKYAVRAVVIGGGVTANLFLSSRMEETFKEKLPEIKVFRPEAKFCTDNGLIVAARAFFAYQPQEPLKIEGQPNLEVTDYA